jgi:cytochrome b subunit of formate dehydrogenase
MNSLRSTTWSSKGMKNPELERPLHSSHYTPLLAVLVLLSCLHPGYAASAGEPPSIPIADCLLCHGDAELTKEHTDGTTTSLFVDEAAYLASSHGKQLCVACHTEVTEAHPDDGVVIQPVACAACHQQPTETYLGSAHALARGKGEEAAATCQDCHGSHGIASTRELNSPLQRAHLAATCGACHPEEAEQVDQSVHGRALARGEREAPTCTDCHSEHQIEVLRGASPIRLSQQICSRCHDSERINSKYSLPSDRLETFLESYHGLSARFGSTRAANCASCHGAHLILPSTDPMSTIHPAQLAQTCGQCHPGANANFAAGKIHANFAADTDTGAVVNRWVRRLYLALIVITIGLFLVHNGLLWLQHALAAKRAAGRTVVRMDRAQRLQHGALAISFILLAVTGFALTNPESWAAWMLGSDESIRRWAHRGAGVILILLGLFHVAYSLFSARGRELVRDFLPRHSDFKHLGATLRYACGACPTLPPRQERFTYAEKIEYWAVVWGTVIMAVTGLMLWFPVLVTQVLPRWTVDVATTIHYYEAILACLAILVWHFYHVIVDPSIYPINWAFWDGLNPAEHRPESETDHRRPRPRPRRAVRLPGQRPKYSVGSPDPVKDRGPR